MCPHIYYFSALQPLWEVQIVALFVRSPQFLPLFISCNLPDGTRWCGRCAKCAFVFVLLSAFVEPPSGVCTLSAQALRVSNPNVPAFPPSVFSKAWAVFGDNLFEEELLFAQFDSLAGVASTTKPLECVGTAEEVRFCLTRAVRVYEAAGMRLPRYLREHYTLERLGASEQARKALIEGFKDEHLVPAWLLPTLQAALASL